MADGLRSKFAFPITLVIGFYKSLYYRTSRHAYSLNSRLILTLVEHSRVYCLRHILVQFPYALSTTHCPLTRKRTVRYGALP